MARCCGFNPRLFWSLKWPSLALVPFKGPKKSRAPQKVSILCRDHLESLNWTHLMIWQGRIHNTTPHLQHRCINSYIRNSPFPHILLSALSHFLAFLPYISCPNVLFYRISSFPTFPPFFLHFLTFSHSSFSPNFPPFHMFSFPAFPPSPRFLPLPDFLPFPHLSCSRIFSRLAFYSLCFPSLDDKSMCECPMPRVGGSNWTIFREQCKRRTKREKPTGECHSLG